MYRKSLIPLVVFSVLLLPYLFLFGKTYNLEHSQTGNAIKTIYSKSYVLFTGWEEGVVNNVIESKYNYYPTISSWIDLVSQLPVSNKIELFLEEFEVAKNWKSKSWFGLYFTDPVLKPWIYHTQLGWLYVGESDFRGIWLWHPRIGWFWTNEDSYTHVYLQKIEDWIFVNRASKPLLIYDFAESEWFNPEKALKIDVQTTPAYSGEVILNKKTYFRWDSLIASATAFPDYEFIGWNGSIVYPLANIELQITKDMTINAEFRQKQKMFSSSKEAISVISGRDDLTPTNKQEALADLLIFGFSKKWGIYVK